MLYIVLERFRNDDPLPVYRRLRDQDRGLPDGLRYISSWVAADLTRCYQIMETDRPELLDRWAARWVDLVEFEFVPVVTSAEARAMVAPRL
jgi:hypothetical protein